MASEKLETGVDYTLAELFSQDRRIIIPDLQRDYCWGNPSNDKSLAHGFVSSLLENPTAENEQLSLGLIYGYEEITGHVNLCDGQQRLTTLFLLLGMLNRKCDNKYWKYLVTPQKEEVEREPFLQYAIRESTLYFINDLCAHFFIGSSSEGTASIKEQPWYFRDYDTDPSIQSMLRTLCSIEEILQTVPSECQPETIAERVLHDYTFQYYNMDNRQSGEETFVLINTTGEPLSVTQNLKPKYLYAQTANDENACSLLAEKWEEWETWFWQNRRGNGELTNDTAETGFREFFRWVMILGITNKEQVKEKPGPSDYQLSLDTAPGRIEDVFKFVKGLFTEESLLGKKKDWLAKQNSQVDWLQILPVIAFIQRNKIDLVSMDKGTKLAVERVIKYFENLARIENVGKDIAKALFPAVSAMRNLPNSDIVQLTRLEGISKVVLPDEERLKLELFETHPEERVAIENAFWKAQGNPIWTGEIAPLIKWATTEGHFSLERFKELAKVFENLFTQDCKTAQLDPLRRALIAQNCLELPNNFISNTNKSFCYEPASWKWLINIANAESSNKELFCKTLTSLIGQNPSDYEKILNEMAFKNACPKNPWYNFATRSELLRYSEKKFVQIQGNDVLVIKNVRATKAANQYILMLYEELKSGKTVPAPWRILIWECEDSCIFLRHDALDIHIDIRPPCEQTWRLDVRVVDRKKIQHIERLREICNRLDFTPEADGRHFRICSAKEDIEPLAVKLCIQISEEFKSEKCMPEKEVEQK